MKKIWLSSLVRSEDLVKKLIGQFKTYGLEANGHFWENDLEKVSWIKARDELVEKKIALWAIVGSDMDFHNPDYLYGLSLLAITAQAARGIDFPIVLLQTEGDVIQPDSLPTPLKGADIFLTSSVTLGPKMVSRVHGVSGKEMTPGYRLDLYGNEHIGQWFEIGPRDSSWPGGMFAVADAQIAFHAVGPKGSLPGKSVLNYPMEGLKLNLGGKEYTAWAVQNMLDPETSYFVKVLGFPGSILFGPYSNEEDAEVFIVMLNTTAAFFIEN